MATTVTICSQCGTEVPAPNLSLHQLRCAPAQPPAPSTYSARRTNAQPPPPQATQRWRHAEAHAHAHAPPHGTVTQETTTTREGTGAPPPPPSTTHADAGPRGGARQPTPPQTTQRWTHAEAHVHVTPQGTVTRETTVLREGTGAAAAAAAAAGPSDDGAQWACPRCTYTGNNHVARDCTLCGAPRGDQHVYTEAHTTPTTPAATNADPAAGWNCPQCTYLNDPNHLTCDMCRTPHPSPSAPFPSGARHRTTTTANNPTNPSTRYVTTTRALGPVTFTTTRIVATPHEDPGAGPSNAPPSPGTSPTQGGADLFASALRGGLAGGATAGVLAALTGQRMGPAVINGAGAGALVGAVLNEVNRAMPADMDAQQRQMRAQMLAQMEGARGGDGGNMTYEQLMQVFGAPQRPRADPTAVSGLPTHTIQSDEEASKLPEESSSCCVCMERFGAGDVTKRLPCLHVFHGECIDRWLARANTCPICTRPLQ